LVADKEDFVVRRFAEEAFEINDGLHASEAGTEDNNAFHGDTIISWSR
jgi:hypothetical protein